MVKETKCKHHWHGSRHCWICGAMEFWGDVIGKPCPVCKEMIAGEMTIHIVNEARNEAFANAVGKTREPKHLLYLRRIGWKEGQKIA